MSKEAPIPFTALNGVFGPDGQFSFTPIDNYVGNQGVQERPVFQGPTDLGADIAEDIKIEHFLLYGKWEPHPTATLQGPSHTVDTAKATATFIAEANKPIPTWESTHTPTPIAIPTVGEALVGIPSKITPNSEYVAPVIGVGLATIVGILAYRNQVAIKRGFYSARNTVMDVAREIRDDLVSPDFETFFNKQARVGHYGELSEWNDADKQALAVYYGDQEHDPRTVKNIIRAFCLLREARVIHSPSELFEGLNGASGEEGSFSLDLENRKLTFRGKTFHLESQYVGLVNQLLKHLKHK